MADRIMREGSWLATKKLTSLNCVSLLHWLFNLIVLEVSWERGLPSSNLTLPLKSFFVSYQNSQHPSLVI